jgi:putative intracellular protease/amidase
MLAQAGVLGGRTVTSWPSLKADLTNAGGNWVDREVSTDRGLATSRKPDDHSPVGPYRRTGLLVGCFRNAGPMVVGHHPAEVQR